MTTPVGVAAGRLGVRVLTAGGPSPVTTATHYTYAYPAPTDSSASTASSGAYTAQAADVVSVAGGARDSSGQQPWSVTMTPSATLPSVGTGLYLAPSAAAPAGLTGTVAAVGTDASGNPAVTVDPDVDAGLDNAQVDYTGPSAATTGTTGGRTPRDGGTPSLTGTIPFPKIDISETSCRGRTTSVRYRSPPASPSDRRSSAWGTWSPWATAAATPTR